MSSVASRMFSVSSMTCARNKQDKYYKILKYAKPIDTTEYKVGDVIGPQVKIPLTPSKYPPYKYEAMFFKRQNRGLFGGLQRKRSKTCSESGNKGLRFHLPNIRTGKLWSATLNKQIKVKVSTKVLKTITKEGGLDNYVTKNTSGRIKTLGKLGWKLRYDVLSKQQEEVVNGKVVYYTHDDGKQITIGKNKLLKELYPLVKLDSYHQLPPSKFQHQYKHLGYRDLVNKLQSYNYDFSKITV